MEPGIGPLGRHIEDTDAAHHLDRLLAYLDGEESELADALRYGFGYLDPNGYRTDATDPLIDMDAERLLADAKADIEVYISVGGRAWPAICNITASEEDLECTCPNDDLWGCISGTVYGPCESDNCSGVCDYDGECTCLLHQIEGHEPREDES